jgi:hypothetical protein
MRNRSTKLLHFLTVLLSVLACSDRPQASASGKDSARDAFAHVVDSLLLDTDMHELRASISIVVKNPNRDDESPFSFAPLKAGASPGHHAFDGRVYADIEVLRELLGRDLPVRLDSVNHRFFVGSPEVLVYGHPHGNAWFVPVKLFARQYGAYVDINCTLATCANIWTKQILERAKQTGAIGTAVLEAHAEGLIKVDVTRLPTG